MGSKVTKLLVDQDIYGYPVRVNYKGDDSYKTRIGAFCTLITYSLMVLNILVATQGFINFTRQEEKSRTATVDKFFTPAFYLDEYNFSISTLTNVKLDPRIMSLNLSRQGAGGKSFPIKSIECSEEVKLRQADYWGPRLGSAYSQV